jgi:hypothetical protein
MHELDALNPRNLSASEGNGQRGITNLQDLTKEVYYFLYFLEPGVTTSAHQGRNDHTQIGVIIDFQHLEDRGGMVFDAVFASELSVSEVEHYVRGVWELLLRDKVKVNE